MSSVGRPHGVNGMAVKRKKKKAAKKTKASKAKRASVKKTKKTAKPVKKAKKTAKAAVKKTPAKKAKKAAKSRKSRAIGEGDYAASRAFLKDQSGFVEKNKAGIPAMGKEAEKALDGPEGAALRDAEATAAARSRDIF